MPVQTLATPGAIPKPLLYHSAIPEQRPISQLTPLIEMFLSILESTCHRQRKVYGLTLVTPSLCGWQAFPTPGTLTRMRIIWALSSTVPQVSGVNPGSPFLPMMFWAILIEMCSTFTHTKRIQCLHRLYLQLVHQLSGCHPLWCGIVFTLGCDVHNASSDLAQSQRCHFQVVHSQPRVSFPRT